MKPGEWCDCVGAIERGDLAYPSRPICGVMGVIAADPDGYLILSRLYVSCFTKCESSTRRGCSIITKAPAKNELSWVFGGDSPAADSTTGSDCAVNTIKPINVGILVTKDAVIGDACREGD